jgi:hypothetical protein
MSDATLPVYVLLGARGSGRREVLQDLLANGVEEGSRVLVLHSPGESPFETETLANGESPVPGIHIQTAPYEPGSPGHGGDGRPVLPSTLAEVESVFFIADGTCNPADMIEALAD